MSVVIQSIHEGTGAYLVKFICSWIPVRTTLQQNNTYYLLNILPISYTVYYKMSKSVFKTRDVNVHKTNSFFWPTFQFVSISKRNVFIYSWFFVNERKINHISFKTNFSINVQKTKDLNFTKNRRRINNLLYSFS
jgi:hypothetical protein